MAVNPNDPLSRDTVESTRQQLGYSTQFTQELKDQESISQNLAAAIAQGTKNLKDFNTEIEKSKQESLALAEAIKSQVEALKKANEYSSRYGELSAKIQKANEDFTSNQEKSLNIANSLQGQAAKLAQDYIDGLTARYKIDEQLADLAQKQLDLKEAEKGTDAAKIQKAREEYVESGLIVQKLQEKLEVVSQINTGHGSLIDNLSEEEKLALKNFAVAQKQMDVSRNIVNNHQDELDVLENQLTPWQKLVSKAMYYNEKIQDTIKSNKTLSNIQSGIVSLTDRIGISFSKILDNVFALDKVLTNFGKSVQVSKEGARELADTFQSVGYRSQEINSNVSATMASIKNQVEANNELNEAFGTGALFTAQSRLDQIELTKGMGLQAETAAKLYQLGQLNQKSAHQTVVDIGDQVVNLRKTTGITLDYKKVLSDVAKVSGQLAVQYKNNPDLIANAVIQTRQLGMSLEQAASAADKLLNFETSIEAELKAELLTGKQINLEQARYFALMGDSASAAKELMANVGGLGEFQKLNVIQQRALAESIGMSADELSNMLVQQETLKGTAWQTTAAFEEAAREAARTGDYTKLNAELAQAANGEELAAQAAQISNQEKFQMAIEKLQETIANMVNGPFGTLLDKFSALISKAWVLKGILALIGGFVAVNLVKGFFDIGIAIGKVIPKLAFMAAEATLTNAMLTAGVGVAVALAAAGLGYMAINAASGGEASVGSPSGGGGGGINMPMRSGGGGMGPTQPIQITNVNTTYVGPNKMSQFSDTQQIGQNTRYS